MEQSINRKPLTGKRILITRAGSQSGGLAEAIEELGGVPLVFPVIRIQSVSDPVKQRPLDEALENLAAFEWILFTSANGVDFFFKRLREKGLEPRTMQGVKVAAVGPKTAEALAEYGFEPDLVPDKYQAEDLLAALAPILVPGSHILLPRADIARDVLPRRLRELGMDVTDVDMYENVLTDEYGAQIVDHLQRGAVDIAAFTSSSTVRNLFAVLERMGVADPSSLLKPVEAACIGPVTAETAREKGLHVVYMPKIATVAGLIEAIASGRQSPTT